MSELRPAAPLEGRIVRLEPIEERHREGLREAAEREPQIHRYTNMYSFGFDRWFDLALANENEVPFVVHVDGRPVGSSRYLNIEPLHKRLEIGWTWLERAQWGTGANVETKYLLLRNAFEGWDAMRVEFKTDARNLRVRGALLGVGGELRGDLPQAHGAARLDPRFRLVRDRRRRLAAGAGDARGEDRRATPHEVRGRGRGAARRAARRRRAGDAGAPRRAARAVDERDGWARVVTVYGYPGWVPRRRSSCGEYAGRCWRARTSARRTSGAA